MKKVPRIRLSATIALLTGVAVVLGPGQARADLTLALSDGTNSINIDATTSSYTTTGAVTVTSVSYTPTGSVVFNGSVGTWALNVTTGESKPFIGSATSPHMDLNSSDTTTAAGTLTIKLQDTGFGPAPLGTSFTQSIGGTMGSGWTLHSQVTAASSNVVQGSVSTSNTFTSSPYSGTSTTSGIGAAWTTYTLSLTDVITATGAGLASFDHELTAVPEPSSMAIAGLGALGMIGYGLRRRKATGA
jgi:hypothetical protein